MNVSVRECDLSCYLDGQPFDNLIFFYVNLLA